MLTPSLHKLSIPVSPISKERLSDQVGPYLIACLKYTTIIPFWFGLGLFFAFFKFKKNGAAAPFPSFTDGWSSFSLAREEQSKGLTQRQINIRQFSHSTFQQFI
jgi:hypothetical protein